MVTRGRVKNGVVVLDGSVRLPEGQEVTVVASSATPSLAAALAEMAADPDIQRELREIEHEFANAEEDGLEDL